MIFTPARILQIGKVRAVAGLHWVPLAAEDAKSRKNELLEELKAQNSRFGAFYENTAGKYPLVGIVGRDSPKGLAKGVPVASWLAEVISKPTIYLEAQDESGDRYWLLAAWPGRVHHDADQMVDDQAARRLVEKMLDDIGNDGGEVDLVVGGRYGRMPSSNVIERFRRRNASIGELLVNPPPSDLPRVKQYLGITPAMIVSAIAAVVLTAGAVGGYLLWEKMERDRLLQEQLAAQLAAQGPGADMTALTLKRVDEAVAAALAEDTATVEPNAFIQACLDGAGVFSGAWGGWRLNKITCVNGSVTATFDRRSETPTGASNETLKAAADARQLPVALDFGLEQATLTWSYTPPAPRQALTLTELPRYSEAVEVLPSRFQVLDGVVNGLTGGYAAPAARPVSFEDPVATAAAQGAPQLMPVPEHATYRKGTVSVSGAGLHWLTQIVLNERFVTLETLELTPVREGGFAFALTGSYVVAAGG